MATDVELQMHKMQLSESGLVITQTDKLKFSYDEFNPKRGGSYIHLPKWVQSKKACINIQNEDDMCFKYSIQCAIYKVYETKHPYRASSEKKLQDTLIWDNVSFPSSDIDIDTFEENNEGKISINVYSIVDEEGKESIVLYRKTKVAKATNHIDPLKLQNGDNYHYVFISHKKLRQTNRKSNQQKEN